MNSEGKNVINLGIGSPDLNPPARVINKLIESAQEEGSSRYQSYRGMPELRQGFAHHYSQFLDVQVDPDTEILPLIGSKEGIMHISMSLLNEGDQVLVPNPGYPSYSATAKIADAEPLLYDLDEENGWMPNLDKLEKLDLDKVKLMWINYPNMPTGARISYEFMERLIAFGNRNNILICHDNPYNFILNDEPKSLLNVPGAKECALELYSLSKCFNMAGWRVGAVIGRKDIIDIIMRFKSNMDSGMYKPVQLAAAEALHLDQSWFDELNDIYRSRREHVFDIFDMLDCQYQRDAASLFVWAKTPSYIANVHEWVDEILHKSNVFITPGSIFGSNGERYVRIALCSTIDTFKEAHSRISRTFVKSLA